MNVTRTSAAIRPMPPRDPAEAHRAATPLELLFDLVSVIAIAAAAAGLHHAIAEAHAIEGIARFTIAFFAIWWAWMNYTWFASAYDNGDVAFRLLTMVVMAGALTMAAGVEAMFARLDIWLTVTGYVVMRVGMVVLWLRAALHDPAHRTAALRYAGGIAVMQVLWVCFVLIQPLPEIAFYLLFVLGAVGELAVPVWAEKASATPWHRHHMIERYGLLNIIVLGETLLAGTMALQAAMGEHFDWALVHVALSSLVILFAMWWLYFSAEEHLETSELHRALAWGYGHVLIYASGAAVGAGIAVLVDVVTHHAHVGRMAGDLAVAIPLAVYMLGLWFVRDRFALAGWGRAVLPAFAAATALAPLAFPALEAIPALAVLSVLVRAAAPRPADQNELRPGDLHAKRGGDPSTPADFGR